LGIFSGEKSLQYFRCYFGPNDDTKKKFQNQLTYEQKSLKFCKDFSPEKIPKRFQKNIKRVSKEFQNEFQMNSKRIPKELQKNFRKTLLITPSILNSRLEQRYTYRVLQTIQMKLILLCFWAEPAILGSGKTALKFKYEI
jgi:hypothetical protein